MFSIYHSYDRFILIKRQNSQQKPLVFHENNIKKKQSKLIQPAFNFRLKISTRGSYSYNMGGWG